MPNGNLPYSHFEQTQLRDLGRSWMSKSSTFLGAFSMIMLFQRPCYCKRMGVKPVLPKEPSGNVLILLEQREVIAFCHFRKCRDDMVKSGIILKEVNSV